MDHHFLSGKREGVQGRFSEGGGGERQHDKRHLDVITSTDDRGDELERALFETGDEDDHSYHAGEEEHDKDDVYIENVLKDLCVKETPQAGADDDNDLLSVAENKEDEEEDVGKRDEERQGATESSSLVLEEMDNVPSKNSSQHHYSEEQREDHASPRSTAVDVVRDVDKRGRKGILKRVSTLPPTNSNKARGIALRKNRTAFPRVLSQQKQNKSLQEKDLHQAQDNLDSTSLEDEGKEDNMIMLQEGEIRETERDTETLHKKDRYEAVQEQRQEDSKSPNVHVKELENLRDEPLIFRKARTSHPNVAFMRRLNPRIGTMTNKVEHGEKLDIQSKNNVSQTREEEEEENKGRTSISCTENCTEDGCCNDHDKSNQSDQDNEENGKMVLDAKEKERRLCNDVKVVGQETSQVKRHFNIRSMDSTDMSMASAMTQKISNRRHIFPSPFRKHRTDRRSSTPMKTKLSSKSSKSGLKVKQGIK